MAPDHHFVADPWWRRSGFWTALTGSVPIVFAVVRGDVTPELVVWTISVWATFFTAAAARPSLGERRFQADADRVMALMEEQRARIRALEHAE